MHTGSSLKSSETSYNLSLNATDTDFLSKSSPYLESFNAGHILSVKVDSFDEVHDVRDWFKAGGQELSCFLDQGYLETIKLSYSSPLQRILRTSWIYEEE